MFAWITIVAGVLVTFLALETYALYTKEEQFPSLSRTIWILTSRWQVRLDWIRPGFTFAPMRVAIFIFLSWLTIHLSFGECALGICP
jgi:hypothetical protein